MLLGTSQSFLMRASAIYDIIHNLGANPRGHHTNTCSLQDLNPNQYGHQIGLLTYILLC